MLTTLFVEYKSTYAKHVELYRWLHDYNIKDVLYLCTCLHTYIITHNFYSYTYFIQLLFTYKTLHKQHNTTHHTDTQWYTYTITYCHILNYAHIYLHTQPYTSLYRYVAKALLPWAWVVPMRRNAQPLLQAKKKLADLEVVWIYKVLYCLNLELIDPHLFVYSISLECYLYSEANHKTVAATVIVFSKVPWVPMFWSAVDKSQLTLQAFEPDGMGKCRFSHLSLLPDYICTYIYIYK